MIELEKIKAQLEAKGYVRVPVMRRWVSKDVLNYRPSFGRNGEGGLLNVPPFGITDAMLEQRLDEAEEGQG